MKQRGFTLLEVMVATLIMAIAVVGLLSALSTSMRTASRLTETSRAALLARQKMDELLIDKKAATQGVWSADETGGVESGWRAEITPFEVPDGAKAGAAILERVGLEIWWMNGQQRRTFRLEGYRRGKVLADGEVR